MGILKPRSTDVTLYHGDDLQTLSELHRAARLAAVRAENAERARTAAEGQPDPRFLDEEGAEAETARAAREAIAVLEEADRAYSDFVTEAAERAVGVVIHAVGATRFSDLLLAHPARATVDGKGKPQIHDDDLNFARVQEMAGYRPVLVDVSTFPRALAGFRDERRRTIGTVDDQDLSDVELAEFLDDDCDEGDLERIWTAAFFLNRGGGDPKGPKFSTSS